MADAIPKVKMYVFLSIIVLALNFSVICVNALNNTISDIQLKQDSTDINLNLNASSETNYLVQIGASVPTSFIPFSSWILTATFFQDILLFSIFIGLIITIISAIQVYILVVVILNAIPFIDI